MIKPKRYETPTSEQAINAQNDLIKRLSLVVVASIIGFAAMAVITFALLFTTTTQEACTEWTVEVRNAAFTSCCKGEVQCPPRTSTSR